VSPEIVIVPPIRIVITKQREFSVPGFGLYSVRMSAANVKTEPVTDPETGPPSLTRNSAPRSHVPVAAVPDCLRVITVTCPWTPGGLRITQPPLISVGVADAGGGAGGSGDGTGGGPGCGVGATDDVAAGVGAVGDGESHAIVAPARTTTHRRLNGRSPAFMIETVCSLIEDNRSELHG
jgi:hypothetical protein